jgi:hypothetical protein
VASGKAASVMGIELGHTDQELLHRHYRELVKPEQAEKYWNTWPEAQTALVPSAHSWLSAKSILASLPSSVIL